MIFRASLVPELGSYAHFRAVILMATFTCSFVGESSNSGGGRFFPGRPRTPSCSQRFTHSAFLCRFRLVLNKCGCDFLLSSRVSEKAFYDRYKVKYY